MPADIVIDMGGDVPAVCQHPDCDTLVHRGIVHICGVDPAGAGNGCGLHFCGVHLTGFEQTCERCENGDPPFEPKPEPLLPNWLLTGSGWAEWRANNPELVQRTYERQLASAQAQSNSEAAP